VRTEPQPLAAFTAIDRIMPAMDLGGGVTGFLSNRLGLSWDVRYFRSLGPEGLEPIAEAGTERLSFWRASMALAVRY